MDTTISQPAPVMTPVSHNDNRMYRTIGIVLGLLALVAIGYFLYMKYSPSARPLSEEEKLEVLNTLSSTYVDNNYTNEERREMLNNLTVEASTPETQTETEQQKLNILKDL